MRGSFAWPRRGASVEDASAARIVRFVGAIPLAVCCAVMLLGCEAPWRPAATDAESSAAYVKRAADDAELAAQRAITYDSANVWERAEQEIDEVEVLLVKARDARERIRRAHRAALAVLDEATAEAGAAPAPPATAAGRARKLADELAAADREIDQIEHIVKQLHALEIPGRR